jgi:hypothetical protein
MLSPRRVLGITLGGAHGGALQVDAVGIVQEAVADGVGEVGIADAGVPLLGLELAGDESGCALGAVLDHLDQVAPLAVGQRREQPVVDREQVDMRQAVEDASVGPIAAPTASWCSRRGRRT